MAPPRSFRPFSTLTKRRGPDRSAPSSLSAGLLLKPRSLKTKTGNFLAKNFPPLQISPRLWICPPWDAPTPQRPLAIRITPGLAFAEAHTPPRSFAWRALESYQSDPGQKYWTGDADQAFCDCRAAPGAASAIGVDLDPRALTRKRVDNAELNGVADKLTVLAPEALDPQRRYPIVIANILAGHHSRAVGGARSRRRAGRH